MRPRSDDDRVAIVGGFTITNGSAPNGGGILCEIFSDPTITNCTIADNAASGNGGGIDFNCHDPADLTIIDCILWGNSPDEVHENEYRPFGQLVLFYCDVQGGTGQPWFGTGCIDDDPLFADGEAEVAAFGEA